MPQDPSHDRKTPPLLSQLLIANAIALLVVACCFRGIWLENLPGVNGDEAWYGLKCIELLSGRNPSLFTPTGNLPNPLFFGPLLLLHVVAGPSMMLLRGVALFSGLAALVLNWWLCARVFDRPTAAVSTVLLAVLPINIAYARFAWDASQTVAVTLPVLYFSLASVRWPHRCGRLLLAAMGVELLALLVHPANIFAGASIFAAMTMLWQQGQLKQLVMSRLTDRRVIAGLIVAILIVWIWSGHWLATRGPAVLAGRITGITYLVDSHGLPHFSVLFARLFTGDTTYQYLAGSRSWLSWPCNETAQGAGLDVAVFWIAVIAAAWWLGRTAANGQRREDRLLLVAWALELVLFLLVAGPPGMVPGYERYAMCLVGPTVVLLARGGVLAFAQDTPRWQYLLAAGTLLGWFLLADFQTHYFRFIRTTGGQSHPTFRTAAEEPKQAALRTILEHRHPNDHGTRDGLTWIVTEEFWNRMPLAYLTTRMPDVRVTTAADAQPTEEFRRAMADDRVWYVEFAGSDALAEVRRQLADRPRTQWTINDYAGNPIIEVIRPNEAEK